MTNIVMLIGPGRYRLTRQALESLIAHTDSTTYNLTLVLDCDTDSPVDFRTISMARGFADAYGAAVLDVLNSGHTISQLKNLGVAWSEQRFGRSDWLYISDSDVWFSPGWLDKLQEVAAMTEREEFRLWGGQIHPFHKPLKPLPEQQFVWRAVDGRMTEHSILDGPSWLMRWPTWDQYGPFDRTTAPGPCQSEEYPFCQRLTAPIHPGYVPGPATTFLCGGGRIGVIHPHVVIHTGLTHLDGHDCVGRKERELMIPQGVFAQ